MLHSKETYEEWLTSCMESKTQRWVSMGKWLYPRGDNDSWLHRDVVIHYCKRYYAAPEHEENLIKYNTEGCKWWYCRA